MTQESVGWIECPCCGDEAARGVVSDGDPLTCGCAGWISLDRETDPEAIIGNEPCPQDARCRFVALDPEPDP